ncbi:cell death-inducing p53-target protein 1 homolog isoform X2 [Esox lucius]|uniref:LITAF domain-containing protein n=1 Tax=Esox lucius TaxID=8010 RepID=A0A3P9AIH0_ESOLU|nr:cell death-inducing p53-target protein 1 homolog isoform X2 [Esox lucius]
MELDMVSLSLKIQQLHDRRDMLKVLQEFRNRSNLNSTVGSKEQAEIQQIDQELQELFQKKRELQETEDKVYNHMRTKEDYITSMGGVSVLPDPSVVYVEAPPSIPAPEVILDIMKLPPVSSRTQCPECRQFITTEIVTSIGDAACLACVTISLFGCVAGCCLIPFCIDNFKDVTHRCPRCRSSIITIKKL